MPGWSGNAARTVPAIPPGDSLVVRITPPRAGTFMYHVHSEPGHQLSQGLYGQFIVVDPDRRDAEHDRFFLLGSLGAGADGGAPRQRSATSLGSLSASRRLTVVTFRSLPRAFG